MSDHRPLALKDLEEGFTVDEVAERMKCSRPHVMDLMQRGKLGYIVVGDRRGRVIPARFLAEYVSRKTVEAWER